MLTELGIAAGKTREEMRQIFSDTQDASIKFRVDHGEVMAAISNVNKMTGDLDFGVKNKDMMAASIVSAVPVTIIFVFLQRYFIQGLTAGAVKG